MARPASTYRAARRNATRSGKAQLLKQFRWHLSSWWPDRSRLLTPPQSVIDHWRHQDPDGYRKAWNDFLAA